MEEWDAVIGQCERETQNEKDVAVVRRGQVVGHLPRMFSLVCSLFLRRGGLISCTTTGTRCYSADLSQGGHAEAVKNLYRN